MQFLDLHPDAMRLPSFPGQTVLGDRGENLSSVLQVICSDTAKKNALIEWVKELTPMDVVDFDFEPDQIGRILVQLIEGNGSKTTAYSASDGTLRFLALAAATLGPKPSRFYFFEELENGIHPTRLHLLLQLLESKVRTGDNQHNENIQVVATSHSPQLLRFLSSSALECASLIYRLPDNSAGQIKRILDIPEARRIMEQQDMGRLLEAGWLEDAVAFLDNPAAV